MDNPFNDTLESREQPAPVEKVVVTLKGGSGYDAPWIVIHATDTADALKQLEDEQLKTLVEKTAEVGKYFAATGRPPAPAKTSTQHTGGGINPPAGYEYKTGVSKKTGRPWRAYMPIDRNAGLETIWLRD